MLDYIIKQFTRFSESIRAGVDHGDSLYFISIWPSNVSPAVVSL